MRYRPMKQNSSVLFLLLFLFLSSLTTDVRSQSLRLLTINVWSGVDYKGTFYFGEYETAARKEQRFFSLLTQIKNLTPDIVFIQEANPVGQFASRLADSLGYEEIHQVCNAGLKFGPIGIPTNFKEGIAILARPKLRLQKFNVWKLDGSFGLYGDVLSFHFDESIFALAGKIIVDSAPVYLVNVHLTAAPPYDSLLVHELETMRLRKSFDDDEYKDVIENWKEQSKKRSIEVGRLLDHITELPTDSPIIIAGDFNAEPHLEEINILKQEGKFFDMYDAHNTSDDPTTELKSHIAHYTWSPDDNENIAYSTAPTDASGDTLDLFGQLSARYDLRPRRIDYVFLNQQFTTEDVLGFQIIPDSVINSIHASDHYGVLSEISFRNALQNSPKEFTTVTQLTQSKIEPLPIITYDTDVGFGYGAKMFALNMLGKNESFDAVLFNSTKGERWYKFVFSLPDFEIRQQKKYPAAIDLIVDYDKWIHSNFFGIGNNTTFNNKETYTKEPIEVSLTLSRGFTTKVVGQIGARYRVVRNFNFSPDGRLKNLQPGLSASKVSFASLFASFRYDTRNRFINPSGGVVVQMEADITPGFSFNDVGFTRLSLWLQYYSVLFYPKTVLALRFGLRGLIGDELPVQVLLPIGGNATLRGSLQDRYLDKTSALINAELRFPLLWRFGGMLGYDVGKVWDSISNIDLPRWVVNPTIGLRFFMDTYVVRLDVGFGKESTGMYFNFGHLF